MLYLDFLDSAKTAHIEKYAADWWRPNSLIQQNNAIELARAEMMVRLLHGDTIVLSNNQATDSVAWLILANEFSKIDLPWETVSIAFFGVKPASPADAIKEAVIQYFSDPKFSLSAWVGLDKELKQKVLSNITSNDSPMFHRMLLGVSRSIQDSDLAKLLELQASGLQLFYEYLIKNKVRLVSFPAQNVGQRLWPQLESLRDKSTDGIPGVLLDNLKKETGEDRLEFRSTLYNSLKLFDDVDREHIRKYIDLFYNEKMGLSVSGGKGVYTITDHNPASTPIQDERMSRLADSNNLEEGLIGNNVLQIRSEKLKDYLKWEDFLKFIKEKEFQQKANFLRRMVEEYDTLNPKDPDYHKQYNSWLGKTFAALNSHQDYLAKQLSGKVITKGASGMILKIGPWVGAAAGSLLGAAVGGGSNIVYALAGAGAGTFLSEAIADTLKESALPRLLTTTAAGKIRTALKEAVSVAPEEDLRKSRW